MKELNSASAIEIAQQFLDGKQEADSVNEAAQQPVAYTGVGVDE
jgi:hypothetical protein